MKPNEWRKSAYAEFKRLKSNVVRFLERHLSGFGKRCHLAAFFIGWSPFVFVNKSELMKRPNIGARVTL